MIWATDQQADARTIRILFNNETGKLKKRENMKRCMIVMMILLMLGVAYAGTNPLYFFHSDLDWFAIQSANDAAIPQGLTDREEEIYRAGYANGHYDALHPAFIEGTYVLNTKTKKFHLTNCMSTLMIDAENRKYSTLTPRELMENMNYKPCGQCHPEQ